MKKTLNSISKVEGQILNKQITEVTFLIVGVNSAFWVGHCYDNVCVFNFN